MHIGGSLRVSLVLQLAVFQYSSRNSRPKSPAFGSVPAQPFRPPPSQLARCTSNRHIWTKSNVSYLNVSTQPTDPRRVLRAICTFFTGPLLPGLPRPDRSFSPSLSLCIYISLSLGASLCLSRSSLSGRMSSDEGFFRASTGVGLGWGGAR